MRVETDYRRDTRGLGRREREKYDSVVWNMLRLDPKPKVGILDMVGSSQDTPLGYEHEDPLRTSVDHYRKRDDRLELVRVLKFFCAYLLQQSRKERELEKQLFSIFKAVDFARMIVQYSAYAVNGEAEAIVFGIFCDLGTQLPDRFRSYMEQEQKVFNMMKRLQVAPNDDDLRLRMAEQMVLQTSYLDAMVQLQYLLRAYPRLPQEQDTRRGRVYIKIGEIFRELAEYAGRQPEEIKDARKLRNFVERYNRDFRGKERPLPTIDEPSANQLKKVAEGMRGMAVSWLMRALAVKSFGSYMIIKQVMKLAEMYISSEQYKQASKLLSDAYPYWKRVPESEGALESRLEYLDHLSSAAVKIRQKDKIKWCSNEVRDYQGRLNEIQAKYEAEEKRKEELLYGDGEPEEGPEAMVTTTRPTRGRRRK